MGSIKGHLLVAHAMVVSFLFLCDLLDIFFLFTMSLTRIYLGVMHGKLRKQHSNDAACDIQFTSTGWMKVIVTDRLTGDFDMQPVSEVSWHWGCCGDWDVIWDGSQQAVGG